MRSWTDSAGVSGSGISVALVAVILGFTFRSEFGNRFMYQHSIKAPDEMKRLHKQFYEFIRRKQNVYRSE